MTGTGSAPVHGLERASGVRVGEAKPFGVPGSPTGNTRSELTWLGCCCQRSGVCRLDRHETGSVSVLEQIGQGGWHCLQGIPALDGPATWPSKSYPSI